MNTKPVRSRGFDSYRSPKGGGEWVLPWQKMNPITPATVWLCWWNFGMTRLCGDSDEEAVLDGKTELGNDCIIQTA